MHSRIDELIGARKRPKRRPVSKAGKIYAKLSENLNYPSPSEFVKNAYEKYKQKYELKYKPNRSINGRIFEYLICETLAQQKIVPFYYQAKFKLVPDADFDVVLYDSKRPVVLTMKTSLRERYKQAALEGVILRYVYREAESYLITLDADAARRVKGKIASRDVMGFKACVVASTAEYDDLLQELKQRSFCRAAPITPCTGKLLESVGE